MIDATYNPWLFGSIIGLAVMIPAKWFYFRWYANNQSRFEQRGKPLNWWFALYPLALYGVLIGQKAMFGEISLTGRELIWVGLALVILNQAVNTYLVISLKLRFVSHFWYRRVLIILLLLPVILSSFILVGL